MAAPAGMATDANGIPQPVSPASLHHPAPRNRCSHCIPASPFSYFLGRMLWGSGALGDGRVPPHPPCAFLLSPAALVRVGLQGAGSVCSCSPVHHWAGSGLAIRCHAIRLQQVGQADAIKPDAIPPKFRIVTNCYDIHPRMSLHHRWRRCDGMLSATAAMQPSPDRSLQPAAGKAPATRSPSPDTTP